jgi:hypothetical protein
VWFQWMVEGQLRECDNRTQGDLCGGGPMDLRQWSAERLALSEVDAMLLITHGWLQESMQCS